MTLQSYAARTTLNHPPCTPALCTEFCYINISTPKPDSILAVHDICIIPLHAGRHQDEPGSSPVGIVPGDAVGRRVFSGISRFPCPFIPALLHIHFNHLHRLLRPRLLRRIDAHPVLVTHDHSLLKSKTSRGLYCCERTLNDNGRPVNLVTTEELWPALNSEVLRAYEVRSPGLVGGERANRSATAAPGRKVAPRRDVELKKKVSVKHLAFKSAHLIREQPIVGEGPQWDGGLAGLAPRGRAAFQRRRGCDRWPAWQARCKCWWLASIRRLRKVTLVNSILDSINSALTQLDNRVNSALADDTREVAQTIVLDHLFCMPVCALPLPLFMRFSPNNFFLFCGVTVAGRLARSPSTKANRVQSPARSPDFAIGNRAGRCRSLAGFLGYLPFRPSHSFRSCSIFASITLIGSQDLAWLDYSPPTKANRVRFPAGSPGIVGIVPDDAAGRRGFLGDLPLPRPCNPTLFRTHFSSPSSALKTSMLKSWPSLFTNNYYITVTPRNHYPSAICLLSLAAVCLRRRFQTGPLSIRKHRHGSYVIRVQIVNTCQKVIQPIKIGWARWEEGRIEVRNPPTHTHTHSRTAHGARVSAVEGVEWEGGNVAPRKADARTPRLLASRQWGEPSCPAVISTQDISHRLPWPRPASPDDRPMPCVNTRYTALPAALLYRLLPASLAPATTSPTGLSESLPEPLSRHQYRFCDETLLLATVYSDMTALIVSRILVACHTRVGAYQRPKFTVFQYGRRVTGMIEYEQLRAPVLLSLAQNRLNLSTHGSCMTLSPSAGVP
ncbi:hypothetical protein PR048_032561 [Dryococelus australis]|uniref:Uncharacterized protein n=1 Tax=Dryococelus australis TaxID=614101 RepID=A0ABQ9G2I9_9NEOP|nr:hypothetical protein PR048_032561 [Dryococelus australis]